MATLIFKQLLRYRLFHEAQREDAPSIAELHGPAARHRHRES
jgi:hypothetical protein